MAKPYTSRLTFKEFNSKIMLVSSSSEIELDIDLAYRHSFASIEYFSDPEGKNRFYPSNGTEIYTVETNILPLVFQPFLANTKRVNDESQVSWAANARRVKVTFEGLTETVYARLNVSSNIS